MHECCHGMSLNKDCTLYDLPKKTLQTQALWILDY